jgi:hypothetical protein
MNPAPVHSMGGRRSREQTVLVVDEIRRFVDYRQRAFRWNVIWSPGLGLNMNGLLLGETINSECG